MKEEENQNNISKAEMERFCSFIKEKIGYTPNPENLNFFEHRLSEVIESFRLKGLSELLQSYRTLEAHQLNLVVDALTTHETHFFRDEEYFKVFENNVLDSLLKNLKGKQGIQNFHLKSCGSSDGKEAISILLCLLKYLDTTFYPLNSLNIQIEGVDISREVLKKANRGLYEKRFLNKEIPESYHHYLDVSDDKFFKLNPKYQVLIKYFQSNLLEKPMAFSCYDVVFCRYVLIYFNPAEKQKIIDNIYLQLRKDGYLILGGSENLMEIEHSFKTVRYEKAIVFQK